jgi:hypothetical protein
VCVPRPSQVLHRGQEAGGDDPKMIQKSYLVMGTNLT